MKRAPRRTWPTMAGSEARSSLALISVFISRSSSDQPRRMSTPPSPSLAGTECRKRKRRTNTSPSGFLRLFAPFRGYGIVFHPAASAFWTARPSALFQRTFPCGVSVTIPQVSVLAMLFVVQAKPLPQTYCIDISHLTGTRGGINIIPPING